MTITINIQSTFDRLNPLFPAIFSLFEFHGVTISHISDLRVYANKKNDVFHVKVSKILDAISVKLKIQAITEVFSRFKKQVKGEDIVFGESEEELHLLN